MTPASRITHPALRAVFAVIGSLMIVGVLHVLGVTAAIDDGLDNRWVEIDGALGLGAAEGDDVVLVAVDSETYAAWGEGPWSVARHQQLLEAIEAARPATVAEVGYGRMFEGSTPGSPWRAGGLDRGALVDESGRFAELAADAGLGGVGERLAIDWMAASPLPTVSAIALVRGEIPAERLAGRTVLIGIDDPAHTLFLDTPVGRTSAAAVEAHALRTLAEGRVPAELSQEVRFGIALCLGLGLLTAMMVFDPRRISLAAVGVGASVVAIDLAMHEAGWLAVGTGLQLVTVLGVVMSYWLVEIAQTFAHVDQLEARIIDRAELVDGARARTPDAFLAIVDQTREDQRWALELLGQFPLPTTIASVWGELEFVAPQMREHSEDASTLVELLTVLTGMSQEQARRTMRRVICGNEAVVLHGSAHDREVWQLSKLSFEQARGDGKSSRRDFLLLTALPVTATPVAAMALAA